MEKFVVNVINIVGNSFCVEADDGDKVFLVIERALKEDKAVIISFKNVDMITSAFLNTAIGQLYRDFEESIIKKLVSVEDMSKEDLCLLKRVVDTAKLFYSDPERLQKSINEIMDE